MLLEQLMGFLSSPTPQPSSARNLFVLRRELPKDSSDQGRRCEARDRPRSSALADAVEVAVDCRDRRVPEFTVDQARIDARVPQFALHGLTELPAPGPWILGHLSA